MYYLELKYENIFILHNIHFKILIIRLYRNLYDLIIFYYTGYAKTSYSTHTNYFKLISINYNMNIFGITILV